MIKIKIIFSNGQSKIETFAKGHKAGDLFYDLSSPSPFKLLKLPIKIYEVIGIDASKKLRVERVRRHPNERKMIKTLQKHPWFRPLDTM